MRMDRAAPWVALGLALAVTAAGVSFAGPTGDAACRDDAHPGIPAAEHYADARTWPPVWACRYEPLDGGTVWRHPQLGGLYVALALAALLLCLLVAFRRRPPLMLQGVIVAWLVVALYGALSTFAPELAWVLTPVVALPCVAVAQRDLRARLPRARTLRWWWACAIALGAHVATTATDFVEGDPSPFPALLAGALLGAFGHENLAG